MQITADVGKISKTVQRDLMFIFDGLLEFVVIFVLNLIFSAIKNVLSFTSNEFSRKRVVYHCVTMQKSSTFIRATT